MSGRARVRSTGEQLTALQELARSDRRDEADRARAVVLSINGWTSGQIARAFGVTPDSVRRWRSWFAQAGGRGFAGARAAGSRGGEERSGGERGGVALNAAGGRPAEMDVAAAAG